MGSPLKAKGGGSGGGQPNGSSFGGSRQAKAKRIRLGLAVIVLCTVLLRLKVLRSIADGGEEEAALGPGVSYETTSFYQPPPAQQSISTAVTGAEDEQEQSPGRGLRQGAKKKKRKQEQYVYKPLSSLESVCPSLPAFTAHHESYLLGATLTRDERLGQLVVDMFFMGVKALVGGASFPAVENPSLEWERAKSTMTVDMRERRNEGYYCVLQMRPPPSLGADDQDREEGSSSDYYWAMQSELWPHRAVIVPTATTVDGNVNDQVNILRCEVPRGLQALIKKHKGGDLQVQLLEKRQPRDGGGGGGGGMTMVMESVVNFSVPVAQRTTGYVSYPPEGSRLDAWKGGKMDDLHMCVPGLRSDFTSPMTEMVVEWMEYHLMQGVEHFYFGADYKWGSKDMKTLQTVLGPYVEAGVVSISSTHVIEGGTIHSECKKVYQFNQCLYHAKGLARWVGIWDVDEFLIPRTPPTPSNNRTTTIMDVVRQYTNVAITTTTADGGTKSVVPDVGFLLLTSYSHALPPTTSPASTSKWIGERFADTRESWHDDAWQKSILSSRDIYYTGFHLPGACTANGHDWSRMLRDDDPVYPLYARHVDRAVAAMFHYRCVMVPSTYVRSPALEKSEYALYYFDQVLRRIKDSSMDRLLESLGAPPPPAP